MTTTAVDIADIEPITHREGIALGREEYRRFADALGRLGPDDWARPTDCEGWTVRDLAGHVVGAMRSAASMRELLRQQREIGRRVKRDGGNEVDHMTALQVEIAADLTPAEVVAECTRLVDPAARGRSRPPAPMRKVVSFPVEIGSLSEKWKLGYLIDVILTRDIWMHRVDLARATDAEPQHDPDQDGRIVAEIVAEWARRHGQPFDLTLTGAAGGHFLAGDGRCGHCRGRHRVLPDAVRTIRPRAAPRPRGPVLTDAPRSASSQEARRSASGAPSANSSARQCSMSSALSRSSGWKSRRL